MLEQPSYPEEVEWELCENDKPCLTLENAKLLARYLGEVQYYHSSIKETCNELDS